MPKIRHPLTRRERRPTAWLFAAPVLMLALVFGRQMFWEAPRFPVPPRTQILECRRNPIFGVAGAAYVQRVQTPLSPAQFWAQTKPLLEAKGMKTNKFSSASGANRAEVRNQMQQTFRPFGLSQTPPIDATTDGGFCDGRINANSYNIFFIRSRNGTMVEFWIR